MRKNRYLKYLLILAVITLVAIVVFPGQAYAAEKLTEEDFKNPITILTHFPEFLIHMIFKPIFAGLLVVTKAGFLASTPTASFLKSLPDMLGQNNSLWKGATHICTTLVKPIAGGILGFCVMVQFIKISQKIDGSQTIPALKEIVFLVAFYIFFSWLITHSTEILLAVYDLTLKLANGMTQVQMSNINGFDAMKDVVFDDLGVALITTFMLLILAVLSFFISAYAHALLFMRAIQLYLYIMFAPISLALLGSDQTRNMGIGFIKNFSAQCLSGVILIFLIYSYPNIMEMAVIMPNEDIRYCLTTILGVVLAYFIALKSSSQIANAILGS